MHIAESSSKFQHEITGTGCPGNVDVPSLEIFKARLNETQSNLVWWRVSLSMAGELELDDFQDSFQHKNILGFYVASSVPVILSGIKWSWSILNLLCGLKSINAIPFKK